MDVGVDSLFNRLVVFDSTGGCVDSSFNGLLVFDSMDGCVDSLFNRLLMFDSMNDCVDSLFNRYCSGDVPLVVLNGSTACLVTCLNKIDSLFNGSAIFPW